MRNFIFTAVMATTLLSGAAIAETVIVDDPIAGTTTTTRTTTTITEDTIPGEVTTYVRENPLDAAPVLEGRLVDGAIIPPDVQLSPVRGYSDYSYFYQDGAPVIVNSDRRVVRIVR